MTIKSPAECFAYLKKHISTESKIAAVSAFLLGLCIHLPILLQDIPNHDGLASIYFDQNMITSGRWFLTIACGISSYFTLPWIIGLLSLLWISITSVILVNLLEVTKKEWIVLISGLLVSFPALASTYAYIFTADGYLFALMLAALSVLLTKKHKWGFLPGGLCLAFSMGTYQSYLSFCILLCLYQMVLLALSQGSIKEKRIQTVHYLYMGILGGGLYYIILQVLLKIQGKQLASYQGISDMTNIGGSNIVETIKQMYMDFYTFLIKGNILANNLFSAAAVLVLCMFVLVTLLRLMVRRKLWKSPWFYTIGVGFVVALPLCTNMILFISPNVGYHLLMRYQFVLLPICGLAFVIRFLDLEALRKGSLRGLAEWCLVLAAAVLVGNFALSVNIGYSNLEKRYEKTYAYCLRLADRMEQTEGYYTGMPVVMMGVVGDENFPATDVTEKVTGNMIGLCGDYLCYTAENYKAFFRHYLGITIEIVEQEQVGEIYNTSDIYYELDSFPGEHSMQVVDGVLYVKTENRVKEN